MPAFHSSAHPGSTSRRHAHVLLAAASLLVAGCAGAGEPAAETMTVASTAGESAGDGQPDGGPDGGDDGGESAGDDHDASAGDDRGDDGDTGGTADAADTDDDGSGTGAPLTTDVRNYIFGHSLILHSPQANVPRWLHAMADAAGYTYGMSGQYGFADTHASELPPDPQWGIEGVTAIWDDESGVSFAEVGFNTVLFTEANFRQYYPPTQTDPDGFLEASSVESTGAVFEWVASQTEGVRFIVYENWPDMAGYTDADFVTSVPTPAELAAYHAFTQGEFHAWWIAYRDALVSAHPDLQIEMVPVGSILAALLTGTLADVPADALYEDNAPHGRPTLYFLAGLVTYVHMFGEAPVASFVPPDELHPLVQRRYDAIVAEVDLLLTAG